MFPDNLKRLRAAAGFTQASFAERAGVPLRTVQNWEQGHRGPSAQAVLALARALSVPVESLLSELDGHKPSKKAAKAKPRGRPRKGK